MSRSVCGLFSLIYCTSANYNYSEFPQLFLLLRKLQKDLTGEEEENLPLYQAKTPINLRDQMNLSTCI